MNTHVLNGAVLNSDGMGSGASGAATLYAASATRSGIDAGKTSVSRSATYAASATRKIESAGIDPSRTAAARK